MANFLHRNGRISKLPAHFATAKIGRNLTLIEDEVEEDKVVIENVANSQLRVGRKIKEAPETKPDESKETE